MPLKSSILRAGANNRPGGAADQPTGSRAYGVWLLATGIVCLGLVRLLTWSPQMPAVDLEISWKMAIQEAFLHGWQFGRDFLFTYGPWGFVLPGLYHPRLYATAIAVQAIFVCAVSLLLVESMSLDRGRLGMRALVVSVIAMLMFEFASRGSELVYLVMLWQVLLRAALPTDVQALAARPDHDARPPAPTAKSHPRGSRARLPWREMAISSLAGFCSLTKFTLCLAAIIVVISCDMMGWWRNRRPPIHSPVYAISLAFFWLLAGQPIRGLPTFLHNSWIISTGYQAMQTSGPLAEILIYLGSATYLLVSIVFITKGAGRAAQTICLVAAAALLWLLGKMGFTRHDVWHGSITMYGLASLALATLAMTFTRATTRGAATLMAGIPLAVFACVIGTNFCWPDPTIDVLAAFRQGYLAQASALARRLNPSAPGLAASYARTLHELQAAMPLPDLPGSVDLYPVEQGLVIAHKLDYRPRPVFQSYSAYAARLAEMNRDHLVSSHAPDFVLFDVWSFDPWNRPLDLGRFPSLDDGLSWPELLAGYELDATRSSLTGLNHLVLDRSPVARGFHIEPIGQSKVVVGEWIDVPAAEPGPIWAEIEWPRSLAGHAAAAGLKIPLARLEIRTGDGEERRYRMVLDTACSGFLLSPLIRQRYEYAWLASTPWSDAAWQCWLRQRCVRSIRLVTEGTWAYAGEAAIRFHRLAFRPPHNSHGAFAAEKFALLKMAERRLLNKRGVLVEGKFCVLPGFDLGLSAADPSVFALPLGSTEDAITLARDTKQIHVSIAAMGQPAPLERAVDFRIWTLKIVGGERFLVWNQQLRLGPSATLVKSRATFDVQLEGMSELLFETEAVSGELALQGAWLGAAPASVAPGTAALPIEVSR